MHHYQHTNKQTKQKNRILNWELGVVFDAKTHQLLIRLMGLFRLTSAQAMFFQLAGN